MTHGRRRRITKTERFVLGCKEVIAFLLSHVGLCALVVGYTILGAVVFQTVEGPFEVSIQHMVKDERRKAVDLMWETTFLHNVLEPRVWRTKVGDKCDEFRQLLLYCIRKGYDGIDHIDNSQYTLAGAYLYSLTVITTIGYGNIACRTYLGKALTIVYAIIGVPLMLLFLTNIGDVFAQVFTFIYRKIVRWQTGLKLWRTRRKLIDGKRRLAVFVAGIAAGPAGNTLPAGSRKKMRSNNNSDAKNGKRRHRHHHHCQPGGLPPVVDFSAADETATVHSTGSGYWTTTKRQQYREGNVAATASQGRKISAKSYRPGMYLDPHQIPERFSAQKRSAVSSFELSASLDDARTSSSTYLSPNSLMEFQHKQFLIVHKERKKLELLAHDVKSLRQRYEVTAGRNVPLWLVLLTMIVYLVIGAVMFAVWEHWDFLDSFYFCFISLTTVGFGDLFPSLSVSVDSVSAQDKLAITSFYLLFGMALIAMCFNLAQEEVVNIVTRLAVRLGVFKQKEESSSSSESY